MLITNATLITWEKPNRVVEDHAVYLKDGLIEAIGPSRDLERQYPDAEILDASGKYVMPGGICAHTHFYGAFARGMSIPGPAPSVFPQILRKLWWPLDRSLSMDAVRASAEVLLVDAIRNGVTTLFDHHASPYAIHGSLDSIAEVVDASGLRAVLCYEVTDRDGEEKARLGIEENLRFLERVRQGPVAGGRVTATFGLHASLTLSGETLDASRSAAPEGTGFHIHVAEHQADQDDSLAKSGLRVVERLERHGILEPKSILAHAVHVDAGEIALLAENEVWTTHQPRSNMNNAVGVAEVETMLRAGVKVCLGTDGFTNDMWSEWKAAYFLQKIWHRDPRRMSATDVAEMAAYNNARQAQAFFPGAPIGVIVVGARADLILVDYHPHTPINAGNLPWQIVFGFQERMITHVLVDGRLLMRDREILTLDEERVAANAREIARQVWDRYESQFDSNRTEGA